MTSEGEARMRGQLESLEWAYADLTERDLIAARPDENGAGRYVLDDGAEAATLGDAVASGRTLVRFAANQLRRSAG